jgi:hypothetical protein
MPPKPLMAEFKVIGKDWGNHVIQLADGSVRHVSDSELEALKSGESEAPAEAKAEEATEEVSAEAEANDQSEAPAEAEKPKTASKPGK